MKNSVFLTLGSAPTGNKMEREVKWLAQLGKLFKNAKLSHLS